MFVCFLGIADKEVLSIKEEPTNGGCFRDGKQNSSVRKRSEFEELDGNDHDRASETELCGLIEGQCFG